MGGIQDSNLKKTIPLRKKTYGRCQNKLLWGKSRKFADVCGSQ